MVVASFVGDAWRISAAFVIMLGIVGFWYFVISRLGSMQLMTDSDRLVTAARADTEPHLVHPKFAGVERLSVRVLIGVNLVMLIQMLLFMPYFVHRFGWIS